MKVMKIRSPNYIPEIFWTKVDFQSKINSIQFLRTFIGGFESEIRTHTTAIKEGGWDLHFACKYKKPFYVDYNPFKMLRSVKRKLEWSKKRLSDIEKSITWTDVEIALGEPKESILRKITQI